MLRQEGELSPSFWVRVLGETEWVGHCPFARAFFESFQALIVG